MTTADQFFARWRMQGYVEQLVEAERLYQEASDDWRETPVVERTLFQFFDLCLAITERRHLRHKTRSFRKSVV